VSATEPVEVEDNVQVALKVSVPPFAAIEFVDVPMLPTPLAVWQVLPLEAAQVQLQTDKIAGKVSVTVTGDTVFADGLVAVIV